MTLHMLTKIIAHGRNLGLWGEWDYQTLRSTWYAGCVILWRPQ
jgi:hypothetical protein